MVTQSVRKSKSDGRNYQCKKEAGMTSHDVVFKLRKILGTKKIGHGGTLDPDVVGVLPIAVGKATRMVEFMQDEGKIYEGEITLGFSTTTEDASGEVVERTPVEAPFRCSRGRSHDCANGGRDGAGTAYVFSSQGQRA